MKKIAFVPAHKRKVEISMFRLDVKYVVVRDLPNSTVRPKTILHMEWMQNDNHKIRCLSLQMKCIGSGPQFRSPFHRPPPLTLTHTHEMFFFLLCCRTEVWSVRIHFFSMETAYNIYFGPLIAIEWWIERITICLFCCCCEALLSAMLYCVLVVYVFRFWLWQILRNKIDYDRACNALLIAQHLQAYFFINMIICVYFQWKR